MSSLLILCQCFEVSWCDLSYNTWPQGIYPRIRVAVIGLHMFERTMSKISLALLPLHILSLCAFFEYTIMVHQFLIWLSLCVYQPPSSFSYSGSHLVLQWDSITIQNIIHMSLYYNSESVSKQNEWNIPWLILEGLMLWVYIMIMSIKPYHIWE